MIIIGGDLDEATLGVVLSRLEHVHLEISLAPTITTLSDCGSNLDPSNCIRLRRPAATLLERSSKRMLDLAVTTVPASHPLASVSHDCGVHPPREPRAGSVPADSLGLEQQGIYYLQVPHNDLWCSGRRWQHSGHAQGQPCHSYWRGLAAYELGRTSTIANVLEGTMSLVGPRPHPVELNRRFIGVVDRYLVRHRVLPGITGLAQVNGFRGETISPSAMQQRVDYDGSTSGRTVPAPISGY